MVEGDFCLDIKLVSHCDRNFIALQTRFMVLRISSGMGWPSADPETIIHSPCNWAFPSWRPRFLERAPRRSWPLPFRATESFL